MRTHRKRKSTHRKRTYRSRIKPYKGSSSTKRRHGGMFAPALKGLSKQVGSKAVTILTEVGKGQLQDMPKQKDWLNKYQTREEMKKCSDESCKRWKDIYASEDKENVPRKANIHTNVDMNMQPKKTYYTPDIEL